MNQPPGGQGGPPYPGYPQQGWPQQPPQQQPQGGQGQTVAMPQFGQPQQQQPQYGQPQQPQYQPPPPQQPQYQQPPQQQQPQYQQPPQQQQQQQFGQPPPQQQGFGAPPPPQQQQGFGAPPPPQQQQQGFGAPPPPAPGGGGFGQPPPQQFGGPPPQQQQWGQQPPPQQQQQWGQQQQQPQPSQQQPGIQGPSFGMGYGAGGIRIGMQGGDFSPGRIFAAIFKGEGFHKPRLMGAGFMGLAIVFLVVNTILIYVLHRYYPYFYGLVPPFFWAGFWMLILGQPRATTDGTPSPLWARIIIGAAFILGLLAGVAMCILPMPWEPG